MTDPTVSDSSAHAGFLAKLLEKLTSARALPDPLPTDPFPIFQAWFSAAQSAKEVPNPNAMSLATIDASGVPSCRMVLCRGIDASAGRITFYTNYNGRKGRALSAHPRAGVCFHWDDAERQVRIEGPVTRTSAGESDAYFSTRPWDSRIGAWASRQSEPLESRAELIQRAQDVLRELNISLAELALKGNAVQIPRPENWGGFHIWAERVELWLGGPGRFHDRAQWTRELSRSGDGYSGGSWRATRLQP